MKKQISQDAAREAVAVLDKLVASNDSIKKVVEKAVLCAEKMTNDEHKREKYASRMIIMHYSNLVAAGGGASPASSHLSGRSCRFSASPLSMPSSPSNSNSK